MNSDESAFNFAVAYLESIKHSLDVAKIYATRLDVDGWYNWILAAYREISLMTTADEDKVFYNDLKEINLLMNNPVSKIKQKKDILALLHNFEMKIRKTMQAKGMVLPKKADPRYAVLER